MDGRSRVAEVFDAVPRAAFLPEGQRPHAAADQPLPIGQGQTNSQPTLVRRMMELLDVSPGDRVLDVGSGSAWTTVLLAHLVGPGGRVHGVERLPDLVELGRSNLAQDEVGRRRATVEQARPGVLGLPEHAPFDRILVSAAARELPGALVDQLAPGGVMVAPVGGRLLRVVRREHPGTGSPEVEVEEHGGCRFVPLVLDGP